MNQQGQGQGPKPNLQQPGQGRPAQPSTNPGQQPGNRPVPGGRK